jgi:hypothetical protein
MLKKLKQIWHEIIERWFLSTFFAERMERERMQLIAQLVERKNTLWKNIPAGKIRTVKEIWTHKPDVKKSVDELVEEYEGVSPVIQDALYEALKNIQKKEKENGNSKEDSNKESI